MKTLIPLFILIFLSANSIAGTLSEDLFTHQNIERSSWVYIPDNYDGSKPYPIVLAAHGLGVSADAFITNSNFEALADQDSFIVVFPEGRYTGALFGNAWNVGMGFNAGVDDIGYLDLILEHYKSTLNIDPDRVYMTGFSLGGMLAYRYACERPGVLAAIASASGSMTNFIQNNCSDPSPIPVLHIHGNSDLVIFYHGGANYKSAAQTLAFWRNVNGCGDEPITTQLPNTYADGMTVTKFEYPFCASSELEVVHFRLNNGGHIWPEANNDINNNIEIWEFFKKHKREIVTSSDFFSINEEVSIYPNPANDHLIIEQASTAPSEITIFNFLGATIKKVNLSNNPTIDISDLATGSYFLQIENEENSLIKTIQVY